MRINNKGRGAAVVPRHTRVGVDRFSRAAVALETPGLQKFATTLRYHTYVFGKHEIASSRLSRLTVECASLETRLPAGARTRPSARIDENSGLSYLIECVVAIGETVKSGLDLRINFLSGTCGVGSIR